MYADDSRVGLTFTQLGLHPGMVGDGRMSHVTRCTSHVIRHTSHVTCQTSHVTRHTSHVKRHTSQGSTHFLPSLIGHEKAARLLLTGDVITGDL